MKPLLYSVRKPDVREVAIPLTESNQPRRAVVEAIILRFGNEFAPSSDEQITKFRVQTARGRCRCGANRPKPKIIVPQTQKGSNRSGSDEGAKNILGQPLYHQRFHYLDGSESEGKHPFRRCVMVWRQLLS
ncbi:MAG: hypothetical protein M0T73_07165 [Deltaproteobacteria bacterium]|nr:hypothetical protein [Deltaproteobacteria bacterium]